MGDLKALNSLRKALRGCVRKAGVEPDEFDTYWITASACDAFIDEIEREISERFMLLPCDADGAPIHVGDEIECSANGYEGTFTVFAIGDGTIVGNHDIEWIRNNPSKWFHVASYCRHVKPDPLKELLRDACMNAMRIRCEQGVGTDISIEVDETELTSYADRIRELMGGDGL